MTSRRNVMSICLTLVVLLIAGQALAQAPVKLRYKFKQGESLSYGMVMDQAMQISSPAMPGNGQSMAMTMHVGMFQKVTKLMKDAAMLEMGFTKFTGEMSMGGQKMPIPGLEGMKKLRMSLRMTERGEMGEPKLLNPDDLDANLKQMADQMKNSITQNSLVFPDKPIGPGETWDINQDLPSPIPGADSMKMKLKSTYKLEGIEQVKGKACAKISAVVKLSMHGDASQGGVPMRADMEGAGKGVNLFAIEDGKMISSEADFNVAGTVTATAQGQNMATKLKMDVKLKMDLQ